MSFVYRYFPRKFLPLVVFGSVSLEYCLGWGTMVGRNLRRGDMVDKGEGERRNGEHNFILDNIIPSEEIHFYIVQLYFN